VGSGHGGKRGGRSHGLTTPVASGRRHAAAQQHRSMRPPRVIHHQEGEPERPGHLPVTCLLLLLRHILVEPPATDLVALGGGGGLPEPPATGGAHVMRSISHNALVPVAALVSRGDLERGNLLHDIVILWCLPKHTAQLCLCQVPLQLCVIFARTHHLAKNGKFCTFDCDD
jgi:hypothetical protein